MNVVGVLLAGGRSERMGEDKSLIELGGKTLIARAADRLRPQVDKLVINANGDPSRYANLHLPVVADGDARYDGPLAGILAGLDWTQANAPAVQWIATIPTDTPFVPLNLVNLLRSSSHDDTIIRLAQSNGRLHQVIGLWPISLRDTLASWLATERSRAVRDFLASVPHIAVDFDTRAGLQPFFNINTPQDLAAARDMLVETGP